MDSAISEENVSSRVPPEIWVKIFALAPESRDLSKLRLVCKQWQGVIDENFDRKVKIDDDKMDVTSIINFKRVVNCNVSKFVRKLVPSRTRLFKEPGLLSTLSLDGAISKPNFLLIAKQCKNVKELYLSGSLLIGDSNLFEVKSLSEANAFPRFMRGLQKLVVNGLDMGSAATPPIPINLHGLLNWQMYELKTLVIQVYLVNFLDGESAENFFDLLQNFHSLERLDFTLGSVHAPIHEIPSHFNLPNLTTLNVEVRVPVRLPVWVDFIRAHTSIKKLKLVTTDNEFYLGRTLVNAILNNAENLRSLEMRTLTEVDNRLIAQLFRGLSNLKSLTLEGNFTERLHHLDLLPNSLEVLVLQNFKCRREEFVLLANRKVNVRARIVFE